MERLKVKIKRLANKNGELPKMPEYKTEFSAAMDLAAFCDSSVKVAPGERLLVPTGLQIELSEGCVALIFARSSLASKHGLCLSNSVGVIDADYRGEVKIAMINLSDTEYEIEPGERIAQMMVLRAPQACIVEADELSETSRGEGGFGSTGRI